MQPPPTPRLRRPQAAADAKPKAERAAYQPDQGDFQTVPVYDRYALRVGQVIRGPAIVEERESTTVLHRGDRLTVDANGCLLIEVALPKFETRDEGVAVSQA
jgi:N-methylhydantoinase A/oxoprolinase/acetone carboxylase beta subunit